MSRVRVLLVDDQQLIRLGLRGILEADERLTVVGEAGDGREALRLCASLEPHVVLMDLRMPIMNGVEATQEIHEKHGSSVQVVVLTTFETDTNVLAALKAGAAGFISKGAAPDALVCAVLDVASGQAALSQGAMQSVLGHLRATPATAEPPRELLDRLTSLTTREREVVIAVASGLSNDEIGVQMFISPFTVKTHLNRAMSKLGLSDRAQVVVAVRDAGLL
ncbi:response regulator transcription factor [Nocardioides endophyticus]|uniref:Response regulator transcription factor n=1 Tax=Nocardioides endophyticus TaxID=1353775 RepID=A0ABP8YY20_9ACTN